MFTNQFIFTKKLWFDIKLKVLTKNNTNAYDVFRF